MTSISSLIMLTFIIIMHRRSAGGTESSCRVSSDRIMSLLEVCVIRW